MVAKPVEAELGRNGRVLRWRLRGETRLRREIPSAFLENFCRLAYRNHDESAFNVTPSGVLRIAREWGPLTERAAWIGHIRRGHRARGGQRRRARRGSQLVAQWRAVAGTAAAIGRLIVILRGDRAGCWREEPAAWMDALTLDGTAWTGRPPETVSRLGARGRREVLAGLLREFLELGSSDYLRDPDDPREPWPDVEIDFAEEAAESFVGIDLFGPVGAAGAVLASLAAAPASRLAICCEPYCALPFVASAPPSPYKRHSFCGRHTGALRWQWDSRGRPKKPVTRDRHV